MEEPEGLPKHSQFISKMQRQRLRSDLQLSQCIARDRIRGCLGQEEGSAPRIRHQARVLSVRGALESSERVLLPSHAGNRIVSDGFDLRGLLSEAAREKRHGLTCEERRLPAFALPLPGEPLLPVALLEDARNLLVVSLECLERLVRDLACDQRRRGADECVANSDLRVEET